MSKYVCIRCDKEHYGTHLCSDVLRKKYVLEFDEPPALVFVQERGSNKIKVYQDGIELHGVRAVDINAHVDDVTTHTIEFITGYTNDK